MGAIYSFILCNNFKFKNSKGDCYIKTTVKLLIALLDFRNTHNSYFSATLDLPDKALKIL